MTKTTLWDASEVCLVLIDYQDEMFSKIKSATSEAIELNIKLLINAATSLKIPIVLSTVGVKMGVNKASRDSIKNLLKDLPVYDRSSMNAWEDEEFKKAVLATGKKRIVMCGLWTEICLAFPVVDALSEGFEVCIPVDAVGGMSTLAHETAITRMVSKGAVPNTSFALVTEFFRDWQSSAASLIRPLIVQHYHDLKRGTYTAQENSISLS